MRGIEKSVMESIVQPAEERTTLSVIVCMGSSCHLKGSYEIIEFLKESLKAKGLEREVILKGSFCMEKCGEGVSVKINDEILSVRSVTEMDHIFHGKITKAIESHDRGKQNREASGSPEKAMSIYEES
jgi:hypothetical protein